MEVIYLVRSMTGYGRNATTLDETRMTVEVRTVNHRFLDLSVKMPKTLLYLEDKIKKRARHYFKRGRIDIFITIEGTGLFHKKLKVDWNLLDQYMEKLNQISERYRLEDSVTIKDIITLEEPFSIEEHEEENRKFEATLLEAIERAMELVSEMRIQEGNSLEQDLRERAKRIKELVAKLDEHRSIVIEQYRTRIKARLEEYIQNNLYEQDSRIIQEVALLAEKGDITEELTRLFSHVSQFLTTLDKAESIGRRLDFIVQEMHREANTIGSKSNDVTISKWVVTLKSEIEKLKEQSQNVE
jgi:uncharacterized protein (TIGR00255 family)